MNNKTKPKSRWIFRVILLLIILGIVALMIRAAKIKPEEKAPPAEQAIPVTVIPLEPASLLNTIVLPGRLEANASYRIATETPGIVDEVLVDKGARVSKGDVLLRLDARLWNEYRNQAAIDLREAEKELARRKGLHESGAMSLSDLDAFQTRYEMAQIALNKAELQLEKSVVSSPEDALIEDRFIESGDYAREGDTVFLALQLDPLKLKLDVPEAQIAAIAKDDALRFTVDAFPGETFTSRVWFVAAQAASGSHAFPVEALADNADGRLRAGMIARVQVDLGEWSDVIQIPLAAIVPDKGDYVVFVANGERAERRLVRMEAIRGSRAVIAHGLEPGERLVVEGHRSLADGSLIEIHATPEP